MSFKFKKITGNNLFTPTILLLTVLVGFYISTIDLVEKTYNFSFILVISSIILILKTFITIFGALEWSLKSKKSFLPSVFVIFAAIQFYLGFLAIDFLTVDKFPQNTVAMILVAEIIFVATTFLSKNTTLLRFSLFNILLLLICSYGLYFKWFEKSIDLFILSQQFIAYIVVICQLVEVFLAMSFYTSRRQED